MFAGSGHLFINTETKYLPHVARRQGLAPYLITKTPDGVSRVCITILFLIKGRTVSSMVLEEWRL